MPRVLSTTHLRAFSSHTQRCGYEGLSRVDLRRGTMFWVWGMLTCGLGFCCPLHDAIHHCPGCKRAVAAARVL